MSLGYAEKLSFREHVGKVGMPELFDEETYVNHKIEEISVLLKKSSHTVVFTGAGISTSCGIPDFRGPQGIWTLQKLGQKLPRAATSFSQACPSFTHMAIKALVDKGLVQFVISQNVDGLHLRSGIPLAKISELHGNCFREACFKCGAQYVREFEIDSIGLQCTGRSCSQHLCRGRLKDTLLDWEDELQPAELSISEEHCRKADLVLCLGTSLQITPACNLPLRTVKQGGRMVLVNLQATPKDKRAHVLLHAPVDRVMKGVMAALSLQVPPFLRIQRLVLRHSVRPGKKAESTVKVKMGVESSDGPKSPLCFVDSVQMTFQGGDEVRKELLLEAPFQVTRVESVPPSASLCLRLLLDRSCSVREVVLPLGSPASWREAKCEGGNQEELKNTLSAHAMAEQRAGGFCILRATEATTEVAVVTHFVDFDGLALGVELETGEETGGAREPKRQRKQSLPVSW